MPSSQYNENTKNFVNLYKFIKFLFPHKLVRLECGFAIIISNLQKYLFLSAMTSISIYNTCACKQCQKL